MPTTTYRGSCHCGAVRFEADLDLSGGVSRCNCTICTKVGAVGVMVKPDAFRIVAGAGELVEYTKPGHPVVFPFCRRCGIHTHNVGDLPHAGGKFVSVFVNLIDDVDPNDFPVSHWDGRNDNWAAGTRRTPWPIKRE
jgi:hypothetical protein